MLTESDEQLLRRETIHPAIFIIPVSIALPLLVVDCSVFAIIGPIFSTLGARSYATTIFLILLIPTLLPAGAAFIVTLLAYVNSEVALTTKRLMYRTGFLSRVVGELPLENVEGIVIFEPLLGRLFGYGTVMVTTLGGARCPLAFIRRPQVLHALIQRAVGVAKDVARTPKSVPAPRDDSRYMPKGSGTRSGPPECYCTPTQPTPKPAQRSWPGEDSAESRSSTRSKDPVFRLAVIGLCVTVVTIIALAVARVYSARSAARTIASVAAFPDVPSSSVPTTFPIMPPQVPPPPRPTPSMAEIKADAERGDPEAQDKLGDAYRSDPAQAIVWYRKAAAQGVANSQYQLAHILLCWAVSPVATPKNAAMHADEGIPWLVKAANQGMGLAQVELGQLYLDGKLVSRDLPEAYKWLSLPADGSAFDFAANLARTYKNQLLLKISSPEIAEGNRRLAAYASNPGNDTGLPEPAFVAHIKLNGISGLPPRALAIINGKTVAAGESATITVDARTVTIQCLAISPSAATITVEGVEGARELRLR